MDSFAVWVVVAILICFLIAAVVVMGGMFVDWFIDGKRPMGHRAPKQTHRSLTYAERAVNKYVSGKWHVNDFLIEMDAIFKLDEYGNCLADEKVPIMMPPPSGPGVPIGPPAAPRDAATSARPKGPVTRQTRRLDDGDGGYVDIVCFGPPTLGKSIFVHPEMDDELS